MNTVIIESRSLNPAWSLEKHHNLQYHVRWPLRCYANVNSFVYKRRASLNFKSSRGMPWEPRIKVKSSVLCAVTLQHVSFCLWESHVTLKSTLSEPSLLVRSMPSNSWELQASLPSHFSTTCMYNQFKRTVPRDFLLQVFSWINFLQAPGCPIGADSIFLENSRFSAKGWHRWQMEKIPNQKSFNYFVCTPLGSRVNI